MAIEKNQNPGGRFDYQILKKSFFSISTFLNVPKVYWMLKIVLTHNCGTIKSVLKWMNFAVNLATVTLKIIHIV